MLVSALLTCAMLPPVCLSPGIEEIGVQIEEPFSILALENLCRKAERHISGMMLVSYLGHMVAFHSAKCQDRSLMQSVDNSSYQLLLLLGSQDWAVSKQESGTYGIA